MAWTDAFTDDIIAIIVILCIIPTLCYLSLQTKSTDIIYAIVGIVLGYYFSKKNI